MEHERRRREEPEPVLLDQDIDLQARAGAPSQLRVVMDHDPNDSSQKVKALK